MPRRARFGFLRSGMSIRRESGILSLLALSLLMSVSGCTASRAERSTPAAVPARPAVGLELPASAQPVPELAPLAFLAGRWVGVNSNKTVNEEHWTTPRGNHMVGTFHQVRRDGKPALVEISLITAEPDGITLRLRHLHGGLEIPERRAELSVFRLKAVAASAVEFTGTGSAAQVTSVVYRLTAPDELEQVVGFDPESKEKGYTLKYVREGPSVITAKPEVPAAEPKR